MAKVARAAAAKAEADKGKAATTSPKKKRLLKGHRSGYTGCGKDQIHVREIAKAISSCCNASNLATVKLLWKGWDNAVNIAKLTDKGSVKSAVTNVHKPGGGSVGNMTTISEQKLQVFAFVVC